jgi:HSP20 family protein
MSTLVIRQPSLLDEFEGIAQDLWTTWEPWTEGHYMRLDIQSTGDELVVKAELPGVGKDGFAVTIEGEELHIEAEKKAEQEVEEGTYYLLERHFGKFSRTLTLPFPVDGRKASATLENGVLEIRLPRAEEAKSKRIEIK